ncbi:MAG TPA: WhiB family transcriptional regulator [Aeromicrobium sp.]|nr:WhiB family transcriptional regulator [Aeromicrobium sp.]
MRTNEVNPQAVLTTKGVTVAYRHPTPTAPDMPWACAGIDPDQFFPEDDATLALARGICAACPVRDVCRELGLARGESGVWGGLLLEDGKVLDRVPVIGRPRKVVAA